jgi:hypothetical protein
MPTKLPYQLGKRILTLLLLFLPALAVAQNSSISGIINDYARVLGIDSCENTLFVQTAKGFSVGDRILIIQMKGASIDTTNTASFGTVTDYGTSGAYEIATIKSIKGLFFTLRDQIINGYDITGRVQIVRIPQYTDATVIDTVKAKEWDGYVGGVIILEVQNSLTLQANIDATGTGFRGGFYCSNIAEPDAMDYFYDAYDGNNGFGAEKGEGIANYIPGKDGGRGPQANGGGGGNTQDAGGGGGANIGTGGVGGKETDLRGTAANGGLGGRVLANPATERIYLGGGGGRGNENDRLGTPGGDGGGIVIIRANSISSTGGKIISNGASAFPASNNTGGDGAGGGGAGGSVMLDIKTASTPFTVDVNGGDGGDNDPPPSPAWCFGPGGGGGGGSVWLPGGMPSITINAKHGDAGIVRSNALPCYGTTFGADSGTDGGQRFTPAITESTSLYIRPEITDHYVTICQGDSATLGVVNALSVNWSPASDIDDATSFTPKVFPKSTTKYYAALQRNSCVYIDSVWIQVNPRPTPAIIGSNDVCGGSIAGYKVSPFIAGNTYTWSATSGLILSGQGTDSLTLLWGNSSTSGSVTVEMKPDSSGCAGSFTFDVTIDPSVKPSVNGVRNLCVGDTLTLHAPAGYTGYKWSNGSIADSITITDSGSFYVDVAGAKCVLRSDTMRIGLNSLPLPKIKPTLDSITSPCDIDELDAGAGYVAYLWNTKDTTEKIITRDSGIFSVIVVDSNGCTGYDTISIRKGFIGPTKFILALDTLEGNTGDVVYYPIKILNSDNALLACPSDYTMSIHFNRTLLVPMPPFIKDSLTDSLRFITIGNTLKLGTNPPDHLPGIQFTVTLGDTTATPIVIDSFTWGAYPVEYEAHDGLFRLANVCYQGGPRLTGPEGATNITVPTPNPASDETSVSFSTIETGRTRVYLSDVTGSVLETLADGEFKPGAHTLKVHTARFANGNYFITLQTPSLLMHRGLVVDH